MPPPEFVIGTVDEEPDDGQRPTLPPGPPLEAPPRLARGYLVLYSDGKATFTQTGYSDDPVPFTYSVPGDMRDGTA